MAYKPIGLHRRSLPDTPSCRTFAGHDELELDAPPALRVAAAFTELAHAI